jgi:hypothetical protein
MRNKTVGLSEWTCFTIFVSSSEGGPDDCPIKTRFQSASWAEFSPDIAWARRHRPVIKRGRCLSSSQRTGEIYKCAARLQTETTSRSITRGRGGRPPMVGGPVELPVGADDNRVGRALVHVRP